jgi:uncharacterized OsmC-like protein
MALYCIDYIGLAAPHQPGGPAPSGPAQTGIVSPMGTDKLVFRVDAVRVDPHGSLASCKDAQLTLDTDLVGRRDALNPAELLLAALAACMLKGIERVVPILQFSLRGVRVEVHGVRQNVPPKLESIRYQILIDSDETDRRLELLHENVRKYGTVFNTVAPGTDLQGTLTRASGTR